MFAKQTPTGRPETMRVAAQILEHLLWAAERWFSVYDPIALLHGVQVIVEETSILQLFDSTREHQTLLIEGIFESFEKEAAEQAGQYFHRQEEAALTARYEAFVIG